MRTPAFALTLLLMTCGAALAQTNPPPAANGNRANGFSYQPTPNAVLPREKAAGVAPSPAREQQNGQFLQEEDRKLLKQYGHDPNNTPPNLATPQVR